MGKMIFPALGLLIIGILFVYSASMAVAEARFGTSYYFVVRQGIWIALGILIFLGVQRVPFQAWNRLAPLFFFFSLVLLLLLYIPGLGFTSHGSHRWLRLGFFSIQPSELMKPVLVLYLAKILTSKPKEELPPLPVLVGAALVGGVVAMTVLFQPDYGGAMILFFLLFVCYYLVGVPLVLLFLVALPALGMAFVFLKAEPYRLARLSAFLDPWNLRHAQNQAYQLRQSFLAFGNGGLLGEGLLMGKQKLFYLPEAHTDFIFAVIGEELGFIGCMVVIGCFLWLFFELARIALRVRDPFAQVVAFGLLTLLALEVLINFGVVTGVLPPKGIALPLISYGGSAMISHAFMLGLFARLRKEER
jgi:cell division protein FtsW